MASACSNGKSFKDMLLFPGNRREPCFLWRQVWVPVHWYPIDFSMKNTEESLHVDISITVSQVYCARSPISCGPVLWTNKVLHACRGHFCGDPIVACR